MLKLQFEHVHCSAHLVTITYNIEHTLILQNSSSSRRGGIFSFIKQLKNDIQGQPNSPVTRLERNAINILQTA